MFSALPLPQAEIPPEGSFAPEPAAPPNQFLIWNGLRAD
jgi:hypothetical protein